MKHDDNVKALSLRPLTNDEVSDLLRKESAVPPEEGGLAQLAADRIQELESDLHAVRGKLAVNCVHEWGSPGDVDAGAVCVECGAQCPLPHGQARLLRKLGEDVVVWLERCAFYDNDGGQAVRMVAADTISELRGDVRNLEIDRDKWKGMAQRKGQAFGS